MPTISEPLPRAVEPRTGLDLAGHLDAIVLDMRERGITPTPWNVMAAAIDQGVPGPLAAAMAATLDR